MEPAARAPPGRSGEHRTRRAAARRSIPGFMTRGILVRRLLLPARLHRCRARGRGGPDAWTGRSRRGSPSPVAARAAASASPWRHSSPTSPGRWRSPVPLRLPARDHVRRHRSRTPRSALPQGAPGPRRSGARGRSSYFDGAILGRRAQAPALFSVGLMDQSDRRRPCTRRTTRTADRRRSASTRSTTTKAARASTRSSSSLAQGAVRTTMILSSRSIGPGRPSAGCSGPGEPGRKAPWRRPRRGVAGAAACWPRSRARVPRR